MQQLPPSKKAQTKLKIDVGQLVNPQNLQHFLISSWLPIARHGHMLKMPL